MIRVGCLLILLLMTLPALAQRPAASVIVKPAQRTDWVDTIEALGTLNANESVTLTTNVTDLVSRIHFDDGDVVEAGQILLEMNSQEEQAQIDQERSAVAEAQAQFDRIKELAERGNASTATLDLRRRELDIAKARLSATESRMADRTVRAPFAGVIGLRTISVGALVQPGTPIAGLFDTSTMKLDFTVPSTFLAAVQQGLTIKARTPAFPDRDFTGVINNLDNRVDPVTRALTVRALIPNDDRTLKPGLLMSVTLFKNPRLAITIPEEALLTRGSEQAVFTVDPATNTAQRQGITLGERRPGEVEVINGLSEGALVVTQGGFVLSDGQPVVIKAVDDGTRPLSELLRSDKPAATEPAKSP